jgi:5-methylcytosine-specific restriction endonuclease McrA
MSSKGAGRTDRAWRRVREQVLRECGGQCSLCGRALDITLDGRLPHGPSVDHIDNDRTNNALSNLRACHMACNTRRENTRRRTRGTPRLKTTRQW